MERWQRIEYAILKLVRAARGEPKGLPVLLPSLTNIIRESVPDCSRDDARYAIDRLHKMGYIAAIIMDKTVNEFREYQGNHEDLVRDEIRLQETSNTELCLDELQKLEGLSVKKRKIGF